ncbi:unnamed protein product [Paramecium pentaurelia]|uniref:Uncharacterized protein n=1 Tax=Paramecium pentaurelia TaxID=43138 RepID=A0A8S1W869_9CILI|nr:unnamed protein product [Paramecium pentaurelia]
MNKQQEINKRLALFYDSKIGFITLLTQTSNSRTKALLIEFNIKNAFPFYSKLNYVYLEQMIKLCCAFLNLQVQNMQLNFSI